MTRALAVSIAALVACGNVNGPFSTRGDAEPGPGSGDDGASVDAAPGDDAPPAPVGPKAYVIAGTSIHRALRSADGALHDPVVVYQTPAGEQLDVAFTNPAGTRLYVPIPATHKLLHFGIQTDGTLALRETIDLPCPPGRGSVHPDGRALFLGCDRSVEVVRLDADGNITQTTQISAQNFGVAAPVVLADGVCLATVAVVSGSANRFHSWSYAATTGALTYLHVTPLAIPLGTVAIATHPTLPVLFTAVGSDLFAAEVQTNCDHPAATPTAIPSIPNARSAVVDKVHNRLYLGGDGVRSFNVSSASPLTIINVSMATPALALALEGDHLYIVTTGGVQHAAIAVDGAFTPGPVVPIGTAPTALVLAP